MRPNKLEVTDADGKKQILEAKNIIIATGARARELPALKLDGEKIIEYREAMSLPSQPKSMIVVGSGAIGTEFAYFYNSIGTKVTIVEFLPRIVPVEDEDISKELEKNFKKQGITIMTNSEVTSVDTSGRGVKAKIKTQDGEVTLEADVLLSAVGISANIENIGLEELGIKTDKGKIVVDGNLQTNVLEFTQLAIAHPTRHLRIKPPKKVSMPQNILQVKNLNQSIIIMYQVVPIALLKCISGLY